MLDLQHTAMDIACVFGKECLYVITVYLQAAPTPVILAKRCETAQIAKTYPSDRGPNG
jgi:hypothetical protein